VVGVSRAGGRGAEAIAAIRAATGNVDVHHLPADLSRPEEVRRMACVFSDRFDRLDALVANAGVFASSHHVTAEGVERTFALNHLGTFLTVVLLLPRLLASPQGRVVVGSSNAALFARAPFDAGVGQRRYDGWRAYAGSKLANLLFTFDAARRLSATPVCVNAVHPGFVATRLGHDGSTMGRCIALSQRLLGRSPERGADTLVWLAASSEAAGVRGGYFVDRRRHAPPRRALDEEAQRRLWRLSEELTGLRDDERAAAGALFGRAAAQSGAPPASGARQTTQ
jgi:retinol dehydrogenase 14